MHLCAPFSLVINPFSEKVPTIWSYRPSVPRALIILPTSFLNIAIMINQYFLINIIGDEDKYIIIAKENICLVLILKKIFEIEKISLNINKINNTTIIYFSKHYYKENANQSTLKINFSNNR